jgi:hypothetical protein
MASQRKALKEATPIAVIQGDALTLFNDSTELFIKEETGNYTVNNHIIRFGRDSAKQKIFEKMYSSNDFDYCLANPPYIREDDHKELFRRTKRLPIGRELYQGKMDYYHFFIELGLSKLCEGGLLCFITTSYWLTAVGASNLRRYILDNALVREVIDFGPTKLFESAKGQFNVIFVLEKKNNKHNAELRKKNIIKVVQIKEAFSNSIQENIPKLFEHLSEHIDKKKFSDRYIDVYYSATPQGELTDAKWDIFVHRRDKKTLDVIEKNGKPLEEFCTINQGLLSGADVVTTDNIKLLPQQNIDDYAIKAGQGVFYLREEEIRSLHLSEKEKELIKPIHKASEVTGYLPTTQVEKNLYCIYINKNTPVKTYPRIIQHLQKFRPILENKREAQEGKLPWYSMHWARTDELFQNEKIIVSKWPPSNDFGFSDGEYFCDANIYIIKPKQETNESLKYILGVLNSKVIGYYFERKGSKRGDKYFFPKEFCQKIPIKPIGNKREKKLHDKIAALVDEMITERKKLLELTPYIMDTQFINQKYFGSTVPELSDKTIVHSLGWNGARPLNRSDAIKYSLGKIEPEDFMLAKVQMVGETLFESRSTIRLIGIDDSVIEVKGERKMLELLTTMLADYKNKSLKEILDDIELPLDTKLLQEKKTTMLKDIKALTKRITDLQENIDRVVMELYGVQI